jgi:DNA polymerase-3 subunit epsilon
VEAFRSAIEVDPSPVVDALAERIAGFAERLEYERAASLRDGVSALIEGTEEAQRLDAIRRCIIVAARPVGDHWDVAAIAGGYLVGTQRVEGNTSPRRSSDTNGQVEQDAWSVVESLMEHARAIDHPKPLVEEQQLIAAWLDSPGARLLKVEGEWSHPIRGAARHHSWVQARRDDQARVWDTLANAPAQA